MLAFSSLAEYVLVMLQSSDDDDDYDCPEAPKKSLIQQQLEKQQAAVVSKLKGWHNNVMPIIIKLFHNFAILMQSDSLLC